jgi:20S proteasome alpha/beta subunit
LTQHSTARQVRYDDGRYSYSLSTFDSKGKLGQVERAIKAGNMGPPVVAIATDRNVFMVAPQVLPSPFIIQDGTTRFVQVTKEVLVSHTGLSADGRVLIAAAQILAIEHEYTFDEEIPVELLLQELSLLYQEYTMKPAARPFGCTLVVGFNPCKTSCYSASSSREPMIYRIDPSGTVTKSKTLVTNDVFERTDLPQVIERILKESNEESVQERLLKAVQQTIQQQIIKKKGTATTTKDDYDIIIDCILAASLSSDGIFSTKRHSPQTEAL